MSEIVTPEEIEQISKEVKVIANNLDIQQNGELEVSDWNSLVAATKKYMSLGLIPERFKTAQEAAGAILYAKQLQVPPLQAIGQIALIKGKYAAYGSLFTALAMRHPDFGNDQVYYINEKQEIICLENKNLTDEPWGCVLKSQKKGSPFVIETSFTKKDAEKAGLLKGTYLTYFKDMCRWKCLSRNYKTLYASALEGVTLAEDYNEFYTEKSVEEKTVDGLQRFLSEN